MLEEVVGGVAVARYVWSLARGSTLILRDRNTGGGLAERLWVEQDGLGNVTSLVNGAGSVVERYAYDPYGAVTVLSPAWAVLGGSAYAWVYGFQGMRLDPVSGLVHSMTGSE